MIRAFLRLLRTPVLVLGLLAVLDGALGLLGPAPCRLEAMLSVFRLHPTRLWALRPDLSTAFQGAPLHTDARGRRVDPEGPAGAGRIHVLGDSLTFGWGVGDAEAWPVQLQRLLGEKVENLAVPGYTTWQGLRVADEEVLAADPRVVLIAYGVNDVSKGRFFRSDLRPDSAQEPAGPRVTEAWNLLLGTHAYRFLRNQALARRDASLRDRAAGLRPLGGAPPRVSLEEYGRNLEALVARVRSRGARAVLVRMPLNLPLPPRDLHPDRAESRARQGDLEGALGEDPRNTRRAWEWFDRSLERGDEAAASRALDLLKRQEVWAASSLHQDYNRRLDEVARRLEVPVVDVEAAFRAHPGEPLFNDPVLDPYHPNARGHRLLAEEVRRVLQGR